MAPSTASLGLLLGLVLVLALGCRPAGGDESGDVTGLRGRALPEPLPRPDFTLAATDGEPYRFAERTRGRLALLFFGYTHCPDVCPIHMANLAAVLDDLGPEARRRVEVVFVSVDPERDTPDRIRAWLDRFDPRFVGLRGTPAEVDAIATSLGLPASIVATDAEGEVQVGHPAQILAFAPDGPARVAYPFGTRQADWAHDLPLLLGGEAGTAPHADPPSRAGPAPPLAARPVAGPAPEAAGRLSLERPVVIAPAAGGPAAFYVTIVNRGPSADRLVGAAAPVAGRATLHATTTRGGRTTMAPVAAVDVPARGEVRLEPGGPHVMLGELDRRLEPGGRVRVELRFEAAGTRSATAEVVVYADLEEALAGER